MISVYRRYFRYFDWISFVLILTLSSVGLLFVYSATFKPEQPYSLFFKKELFGIIAGILLYFIFCSIDYRLLLLWGYWIYITVICLLIFTLIKGKIGMGGQRWVDLFFFRFQPSELAKLFFPAFFTQYLLQQSDSEQYTTKQFLFIIFTLFFSALLIIKQPDLGTGLLVLMSGLILLWFTGLKKRYFAIGFILLCVNLPLIWNYGLKSYQKNRILVFMGKGDSKKERYQLEQSKIAIGSGALLGKGFLKGTQNKLMFLPESRTDFIFSVIAEEWGFIGAVMILLLYVLLFVRLTYLTITITNFHTQILALGLIIPCVLASLVNLGMVTGMLPIVGIPLPLISYGITHIWVTFAMLGWFNGIIIRQSYLGE